MMSSDQSISNDNNKKRSSSSSNDNDNIAAATENACMRSEKEDVVTGQFADDDEDEDLGGQNNIIIQHHSEDQLPHVLLMGSNANLAPLRQESTRKTYFSNHDQPAILSNPIKCRLQWGIEEVQGEVCISSCQVCFIETLLTTPPAHHSAEPPPPPRDLAIGATCITLHAMTEEPELAIYLQLNSNNYEGDDNVNYYGDIIEDGEEDDDDGNAKEQPSHPATNISEVTITPLDSNLCQQLFDGLCKLVSKHPLDLDDDDDADQDNGGSGGMFGGGFGFASNGGGGDNDDDMVWAPSGGFVDPEGHTNDDTDGGGATEEERAAMLERLDNLLIENPQYENAAEDGDGQFDDAEEL